MFYLYSICVTDTGVRIDKETSYTAGIMLLSLIPFVLVQPVTALNSFVGRRILIFITLIVSLILLVSYFLYQVIKISNVRMLRWKLNLESVG